MGIFGFCVATEPLDACTGALGAVTGVLGAAMGALGPVTGALGNAAGLSATEGLRTCMVAGYDVNREDGGIPEEGLKGLIDKGGEGKGLNGIDGVTAGTATTGSTLRPAGASTIFGTETGGTTAGGAGSDGVTGTTTAGMDDVEEVGNRVDLYGLYFGL